MATQECPNCGALFEDHDAWPAAALSTLMVAPAVDDMAIQVRCPKCRYLFVESQVRYARSSRSRVITIFVWACIACLFAWAVYAVLRT